MHLRATEDEFRRVVCEISRYLAITDANCQYSELTIYPNQNFVLRDKFGPDSCRREMGWQTLFEEIERGLAPNLEETVKNLKLNFTPRQLAQLKEKL